MKLPLYISAFISIVACNGNSHVVNEEWTPSKKAKMINIIINSSKYLKSTDSARAHQMANCSLEKLISLYTYEEMMSFDKERSPTRDSMLRNMQLITSQCFEPYKQVIVEEENKQDCIEAVTRNGKMTTDQAAKFCSCVISYLNSKYTAEQLRNYDSIFRLERERAIECLNISSNQDSAR